MTTIDPHLRPPPSVGPLNRVGVVGGFLPIGGGSDFRAVRSMHWDVLRRGIRAHLDTCVERCERAGVTQASLHNPGGTDGAMSFAQMFLLEQQVAALDSRRAYADAMERWERRLGWRPVVYVGKVEDQSGVDPQFSKIGLGLSLDSLLEPFGGCEIVIDHSARYGSGTRTREVIDALQRLHVKVGVEPRPPRGSDAQNDPLLSTATMSGVFRRSLSESWATPLDECQNSVHRVLVWDQIHLGEPVTAVDEVRRWLAWGLDVFVPLDEHGRYLGVRAGDIRA